MGELRRHLRATFDYVVFVYGSEWKYVVGLIGVVLGFIVALMPSGWVFVVTGIGAVITVALFLVDTRELRSRWTGVRLHNNKPELNSFRFDGVQWEDGMDGFVRFPPLHGQEPGSTDEYIWTDPEVNRLLWTRSEITQVWLSPHRFELPRDLADIAPQSLRRTAAPNQSATERTKRPMWFNGRLARLSSEPTPEALGTTRLAMQEVTYFDGQASNELWHWSRDETIADGGSRLPLHHVVDTRRRILSLEQARMANIVGITIFAITADEQVLFVRQSMRNSVQPGWFAASASGSLDWADVVAEAELSTTKSPTLGRVLMRGMLRELDEESRVRAEDVLAGSERVTGYFRWLNRGAKPEFSGLVRLTVTLAELEQRTIASSERPFTDGHAAIPVEHLLAERPDGWSDDTAAMLAALNAGRENPTPIGTSTRATWQAAADYLEANPEYLTRTTFTERFTSFGYASWAGKGDPNTNEDYANAGNRAILVLDGATGLGEGRVSPEGSDARWFAHTVGDQLSARLGGEGSLTELIALSLAETRRAWAELPGSAEASGLALPTAGLAVARLNEDRLEWATLGDCRVVLATTDAIVEHVADELRALDAKAIAAMVEIAERTGCTVAEARGQIVDTLRAHRQLQNVEYAILDLDGAGLDRLRTGSLPVSQVRAVMLASDGFAELWDGFGAATAGEVLGRLNDDRAQDWLAELFELRDRDPDHSRLPRFKLHDDSTVAWARLGELTGRVPITRRR
ncbi:protein phosphatase 2C domain-containing protein [Enemella sp. A6]|uniref:protein phosphatase 2C domain-containing protein n=1 Tax=Enemella sp. A6 TaxID=3440152 RepID=UPI003EBE686E